MPVSQPSSINFLIYILSRIIAIQGKDCLVQKFRNSSVMLEAPHYRPKVSRYL